MGVVCGIRIWGNNFDSKIKSGCISKIIFSSSHFRHIAEHYPFAIGNQGYLVVEMEDSDD